MTMRWFACVLFFAVWPLVGCGSGEPSAYRVTGIVTWQGAPVPEGDIVFSPEDGKGAPQAGKIAAGRYEVRATAGKKRVEIFATREGSQADPVMNAKPREQFIPARFNTQSTLTTDVQPHDDNQSDFTLK
jgi:hypothetical protein